MPPKALVDDLVRLEARLADLDELLSEASTTVAPKEITEEEVRLFLEKALGQLQEILSGSAENVKTELQKRISSIVLTPSRDSTGPLYTISGDVALFSSTESVVQGVLPHLDDLHYNVPISLKFRPYRRRPKCRARKDQCSTSSEGNSDPRIPGSIQDVDELQETLESHPVVIALTDVGTAPLMPAA